MSARNGFVLLEAVAALMIVSVTSVAVFGALGTQMRGAERAAAMLQADALARDRLARMEMLDARELAFLPDSMARGAFTAPLERYRWTARAQRVSNERHLYDASVTIEWDDGAHDVATRLYRRERGAR